MMTVVRTVAFLHLFVYVGIMWYGWQSYKILRKSSWKVMGIGFGVLLVYRIRQLVKQMTADYVVDTENTLLPFIAAVLLLVAFRMLCREQQYLLTLMAQSPSPLQSGAQPVEYWLGKIRLIMREEIAAASGTTTVTVKGPAATIEPVVKKK